jgi:hypothetical protein
LRIAIAYAYVLANAFMKIGRHPPPNLQLLPGYFTPLA